MDQGYAAVTSMRPERRKEKGGEEAITRTQLKKSESWGFWTTYIIHLTRLTLLACVMSKKKRKSTFRLVYYIGCKNLKMALDYEIIAK